MLLLLLFIPVFITGCNDNESNNSTTTNNGTSNESVAAVREPESIDELTIKKSDITEIAKFYPVIVDGIRMEVIAVRASDGGVRTAFNACQVCATSGRGYYIQVGDTLVCQNCGNVFNIDDVEKVHGGCNPAPITKDDKTEDNDYIKIPKSTFEANIGLFNY
jgi:nitrite reductase/ring-hydroxylating ferredoxin subunit